VTSSYSRPAEVPFSRAAEVDSTSRVTHARAPLTKAARQAKITDLITRGAVHSQSELADQLIAGGLSVTQATLSRDLAELGAFKVRGAAGLVYALPASAPSNGAAASGAAIGPLLVRRLAELLISAEAAGSMVVLRTPPGGAHLLASGLDGAELPEVAGTIAGDDTVLLVCRPESGDPASTDAVAARLAARLLATAQRTD
jgi:transcriptional regulator of arginine metabolism